MMTAFDGVDWVSYVR